MTSGLPSLHPQHALALQSPGGAHTLPIQAVSIALQVHVLSRGSHPLSPLGGAVESHWRSASTSALRLLHHRAASHPAPALSAAQYFASTMIIVGLSVVVTVIVLQYHHHDPDGGKMPKWVRLFPAPHPRLRESGPLPNGGARMTSLV